MYSTVDDLWKWRQALQKNTLLSAELTERMTRLNLAGYCYGWFRNHETFIRRYPSGSMYHHGGALDGFQSHIAAYDDGITIIFLSNVNPVNDITLLKNLHLVASGMDPETYVRDILRPEIEDDLASYLDDGGRAAFDQYYQAISERAGYKVLPSPLAYVELMVLYLQEDKMQEAEEIIGELFSLYKHPAESTINRIGYAFLGEEKYDHAIRYFRKNIELYPHSPNCYDSLGEAYQESGNEALAVENFSMAVKLAKQYEDPGIKYYSKNYHQATQ